MAPSLTERCVDCGCEFAVPTAGTVAYFCARCARFYSVLLTPADWLVRYITEQVR